jgi:hypothetical protein
LRTSIERASSQVSSAEWDRQEQRWLKASTNTLLGELQGATTLAEFGQRLISSLMPMLGGSVANFYLFENRSRFGESPLWAGRCRGRC